jgi:cyclin-dependent kinase-like
MKNLLSFEEVRNISLQIAKGISYLHKNKIVYADIKPENILLTKEKEVKLCDFGSAFRLEE